MKLAILADIHANFVALQTVTAHIEAWEPDGVIVAGDVVNRGPCPLECLRFVQQKQRTHGWQVVRGNHEDYVIHQAKRGPTYNKFEREFYQFSYWTYTQLNGQVAQLEAMPFQCSLSAPDGSEVRVTHASMRGNREGIFSWTPDLELHEKIGPSPPALFCVGHTHRPLIRRLDETLVVNVGAAGLPFDHDTRAAYAQLVWRKGRWQPKIVRLDYDRAQTERDFVESGFLIEGGPMARLVLDELQTARSHLYYWTQRYQAPILSGEMTVLEAVQQFMADL